MRLRCKPVDAGFFDAAPWRFVNQVELDWSADRVFTTFEDAASWPQWFGTIRHVEWTSPRPFGIGTTRTVKLTSVTVYERFFRWEQGRRFSFDLESASLPLFRSLAEDYLLEPFGPERSRFTYTVAIAPALLLQLSSPVVRSGMASDFRKAALGLQRFCSRSSP